MATPNAVGKCLALFGSIFPRDISPELTQVWIDAFSDVTDEQLGAVTRTAIKTAKYFPVPAELRDMLGANHRALPDVAGIRDRLRHMAAQNDDRMPSVERVRLVLGPAIASAYSFIGPHRLEGFVFDGYGVGTDIATREFGDALSAEQDHGADLTLPSVADTLRLNAAPQLPPNVQKLLRESSATSSA